MTTDITELAQRMSIERIKQIALGGTPTMGERESLAITALHFAEELKIATDAFQAAGLAQLAAEEALEKAQQRNAELEAQNDYFAYLVAMARVSADKAIRKFPQPNYVLLKVAEEAGEVVQAGVHYAENRMEWGQVEGEIVQLLAMLIRLVTEGDQVNGITPPASCSAGIKVEAE
ncbi:hypothetical protein [Pluralibacter gergoviae]|uniref:hypothetical protein n=1 Tax=Pluralibacter gergoviae TaxID=61647 RepID=UPI001FF2F9B1|nr:hypothetical protein [Pluralibacter gergoviae]MCK1065051.1 hypothetical protein [Pluralibacter gergoviae]